MASPGGPPSGIVSATRHRVCRRLAAAPMYVEQQRQLMARHVATLPLLACRTNTEV